MTVICYHCDEPVDAEQAWYEPVRVTPAGQMPAKYQTKPFHPACCEPDEHEED